MKKKKKIFKQTDLQLDIRNNKISSGHWRITKIRKVY